MDDTIQDKIQKYRKEEDKNVPCIVELLMIDMFCIKFNKIKN